MSDKRMVSVSVAQHADAARAGEAAALAALAGMGPEEPSWGLFFCGGRLDPYAAWTATSSMLPGVPLVGGATSGIIARPNVRYTGYECGLMLFGPALSGVRILTAGNVARDALDAGVSLGARMAGSVDARSILLMVYENLTGGLPAMDSGVRLLAGLRQALREDTPPIWGAGLLGDNQFSSSFVFDGRGVTHNAAVIAVLPPCLAAHTTIMTGCFPVSVLLRVTRCRGPVIEELDGQPALHVLRQLAPGPCWDDPPAGPRVLATLGMNMADPYGPCDESAYVNHLVVDFDPLTGSVMALEADFVPGDLIQVMARDDHAIHRLAEPRVKCLLDGLAPRQPAFGLYVDCAGRAASYCGTEEEEADRLLAELPPALPLLGWYSTTEVAPIGGRSRVMNWTGVLTLFTVEESPHG